MPPSRDPTPEHQGLTSPNLKRERRMSTRGEDVKADKGSRKLTDKAASKLRGRKIMVPGEVQMHLWKASQIGHHQGCHHRLKSRR